MWIDPEAVSGWRLLCAGLCLLTLGSGSALASGTPEPAWTVDPAVPGDSLPATGRSLFDRLFASLRMGRVDYALPFPFSALLARLDAQLEHDVASTLPPVKRVLIPLSRSLQRTAAAPDFFSYPRVVVVADAQPASPSALFLKDRLYIAYQEKSAVLEVISYNEDAGRFEFQLVKDYRAGAKPRVVYANRTLCFACHQNGAPIFPRALWDETNANPQVAARLVASGRSFHGIAPERGVDIPYAIDVATRRANGLALTQRLWREGCGGAELAALRCRAGLFTAALRHALAAGRKATTGADFGVQVDHPLRSEAARRWPGGLAVAASDIPNRNPLQGLAGAADIHVPARFEALVPRPPPTIWRADASDAADQLIAGLAEFVAGNDLRRLDIALAARAARRVEQRVPCRLETQASRWSVRCRPAPDAAGARLSATLEVRHGKVASGVLERLTLPGAGEINSAALRADRPRSGESFALRPTSRLRAADGNPLVRLAFRLTSENPPEAMVRIEMRDEFAAVEQEVAALLDDPQGAALFAPRLFPRARLFAALLARLGAPSVAACCRVPAQLADRLAPPALDVPATAPGRAATTPVDAAVQGFYPYCATCHQSNETFPPNFLSGNGDQVSTRLHQCAPRLYVRLAMADLAPEQRDKTPMPPESLLPALATDRAGWRASPARAALLAQVGDWLRAENGVAPTLDKLLAGGYEALRPCLPAQ